MKKFFWAVLGFIPLSMGAENSELPWEKLSDFNGIKVFRREVPGSPLVAFKGEGVIEAPIAKVAGVINDFKNATDWVDRLEDIHLVREISPHEWIEYRHIGTPIVMKDRDFVIKVRTELDRARGFWYMHFNSVEDPKEPKTDYIRGELMDTSFKLKPIEKGTQTYIWVEVHADPKGSVPKWIVNLFQRSWARNTIQAIRKRVANAGAPELKELVGAFK